MYNRCMMWTLVTVSDCFRVFFSRCESKVQKYPTFIVFPSDTHTITHPCILLFCFRRHYGLSQCLQIIVVILVNTTGCSLLFQFWQRIVDIFTFFDLSPFFITTYPWDGSTMNTPKMAPNIAFTRDCFCYAIITTR